MTHPDMLVVGVLKIAIAVGVAYLTGVAVLAIAARATNARLLSRVADAITPRLFAQLLGLTLGAAITAPASAYASRDDDAPVVMRRLDDGAAATTTTPTSTPPTTTTLPEPVVTPPAAPRPLPAASPQSPDSWIIQPGEHFWAVAEAVVRSRLGREPTAAETAPYWRRVVQANRHRLAYRSNPHLVYPGQIFVLPPP